MGPMPRHAFHMLFRLPAGELDAEPYLEQIWHHVPGSRTVRLAPPGFVGVSFSREAATREGALASAVTDMLETIPGCERVAWPEDEAPR